MSKSQEEKNYKEKIKEKFNEEDNGVWDPLEVLGQNGSSPFAASVQPEDSKVPESQESVVPERKSGKRGRPKKESPEGVSSDASVVKTSITLSRADYRMLSFFKTAVLDETGKSYSLADIFSIAFRDSLDHELKKRFPESVEFVRTMEKTSRK